MSAERLEPLRSGEPATPDRPVLDRRAFLAGVGVAAGTALAAAVLPLGTPRAASIDLATAAPVVAPAPQDGPSASASLDVAAGPGPDDSWHIDDMWGHWPRYAHPIPHAAGPPSGAMGDRIDPVDRLLVI